MPFPTQKEIEMPLLQVLDALGGKAKPQEVYSPVAKYFPELTENDLSEHLASGPVKWWNLVQWSRQALVRRGEIDGAIFNVWALTKKGSDRLKASFPKTSSASREQAVPFIESGNDRDRKNLKDLVYQNRDSLTERLLTELNGLSPTGFEHFCRTLLERLGYDNMVVTKRSNDGGIDGHGDYRQGIVKIRSAFQAKRWKDTSVGRPEIDKFRGAIQGDYDHGLFLTTSSFSEDARAVSVKKGAITILLLDGATIAKLMIDFGIGVTKEPVYILDIDDAFFTFEQDSAN